MYISVYVYKVTGEKEILRKKLLPPQQYGWNNNFLYIHLYKTFTHLYKTFTQTYTYSYTYLYVCSRKINNFIPHSSGNLCYWWFYSFLFFFFFSFSFVSQYLFIPPLNKVTKIIEIIKFYLIFVCLLCWSLFFIKFPYKNGFIWFTNVIDNVFFSYKHVNLFHVFFLGRIHYKGKR